MTSFEHLPSSLSRRKVLKLFGMGIAGSATGYSRLAKPIPTRHEVETLDLPRYINHSVKVVVVGAGLAGLATAYELSQRGVQKSPAKRSKQSPADEC